MSIESMDDIGMDRSDESCGSADAASDVSEPGNKHCISLIWSPKATHDCRRRPIGLRAAAQVDDDGPNMETYHEGAYRCTRVGYADCRPDVRSARERGPGVPVELLVRV